VNTVENRSGSNLAFAGGMGAIVVYLVGAGIAWWLYPHRFTPLSNWLSDLGNYRRNPDGAVFYNLGCVLTALALLVFVIGLSSWRAGALRERALIASSQLTGFASVVSLAGLGVYSEDRIHQHMVYSNWFFASFPLFIVLLSRGILRHPRMQKSVAVLGFAVVLLGLVFHVAFPRSRPLEWVTELGFLTYVGLLAFNSRPHSIAHRHLDLPSRKPADPKKT
jgi:hypothetical membrane protein